MNQEFTPILHRRLLLVGLLSWLSMLGFDFFFNAGPLAELYLRETTFLLPPMEAFKRIPLGYLSFLLSVVLLLWLLMRLKLAGWRTGSVFGLKLGALIWGSFVLGLLSISTADVMILLGWFVGQATGLAIAGAVAGAGLRRRTPPTPFREGCGLHPNLSDCLSSLAVFGTGPVHTRLSERQMLVVAGISAHYV